MKSQKVGVRKMKAQKKMATACRTGQVEFEDNEYETMWV